MACEERVSNGYEYKRGPFGLRETNAEQTISNKTSGFVTRQIAARESFRNNPSRMRPNIVRSINTRPKANPACMLTQRTIKGASHQSEGTISRREYRSKRLINTLANNRENICGRTPQVGIVARAPRSIAKAAM